MLERMTAADVPFILDCLEDLKEEAPTQKHNPANREYVGPQLEAMFSHGLVGLHTEFKGFMLATVCPTWYDPRLEAYELILYVRPAFRVSRVGVTLIRGMERAVKEAGATKMTVGASLGIRDTMVENLYVRLDYEWKGNSLVKEF